MHVFFLVDEYTDVEESHVVREMVDVVLDAMRHPQKPRPVGEVILGEIARQCVQFNSVQILSPLYSQFAHRFWERAIPTASPASQRHMIATIADFLESIVDQAIDRDANRYRTVDQYMERRRRNVGTRPSCVPLELSLNLTDEVFYHPVVEELTDLIVELIIIDNVSHFSF